MAGARLGSIPSPAPGSDATQIRIGAASLECGLVPWDSDALDAPVASINSIEIDDDADGAAVLRAFRAWLDAHEVRFASCRLDHLDLRASMALEGAGFRFIETVYRPRLTGLQSVAGAGRELVVKAVTDRTRGAVLAIAETAFDTGRFALDPRLPRDLSGRRYTRWVVTSLEDQRLEVVAAELDDNVVGFFVTERLPGDAIYWHLTAVAPDAQGRGIGMDLWRTMVHRHAVAGATSIETTISGHNVAVINLYAKLGFLFRSSSMTFHWLREDGDGRS